MRSDSDKRQTGRWSRAAWAVLAAAWAAAAPAPAGAQESYARIEEDWEIVIFEPDYQKPVPQIVVASRTGTDTNSTACLLNFNFRQVFIDGAPSTPLPGGLQAQVWKAGPSVPAAEQNHGQEQLSQAGETIRWTQYMTRNGSQLTFGVTNFSSQTWGNLADDTIRLVVADPAQAFTQYDPAGSVNDSGILYGANRVQSLKLLRVRKYRTDGTLVEDNTERVLHVLPTSP